MDGAEMANFEIAMDVKDGQILWTNVAKQSIDNYLENCKLYLELSQGVKVNQEFEAVFKGLRVEDVSGLLEDLVASLMNTEFSLTPYQVAEQWYSSNGYNPDAWQDLLIGVGLAFRLNKKLEFSQV